MPSIFGNDIQTGKPGPQKEEPQGSLCLNTHTQKSLSRVRLFATPWIVAHQAPRSMEFSRHEYWSGLPFPLNFSVNRVIQVTGKTQDLMDFHIQDIIVAVLISTISTNTII